MTTLPLSPSSPFATRFLAWMKERFPFANALLFFILYLTTAAVSRSTIDGAVSLSLQDLAGALVTWSFFLVLRVFDEHKDYELDCRNHPQRVLQSGLITLLHLRIAAAIAIASQILWSVYLDGGLGQITVAWLAMFLWTCLMGREFFVADWLNRHLTWYAVSHMLVMPLIVWWLANLATPGTNLSPELRVMMLLAFISGFCFEITRKTKGPEEERDTIESYSRIFGTRGSAVVVMFLVTAMVLNQVWLITLIAGDLVVWALTTLTVFLALALFQILKFIRHPSTGGREKNEAMVALTMLAGYAVLISVVVSANGLSFKLI